ncbi:uncharacterized protein SCHCODRAFT_02702572 [Schizophyllum commune H4-8]|uniref:uncharacterized protein n=1 Tax=Schizophyllum commune (strain H4-8 / FGSC 9210) TaxID=578458 RepID=UPI00215ED87E|nr:uncharacterized protein SCHCODRAFT_02702572 [Schizophyllum commune H4-8]KAI5889861.1 hypothetical protein SCHCODRAFT_02702572 [Schizophyllum commune H4-8]
MYVIPNPFPNILKTSVRSPASALTFKSSDTHDADERKMYVVLQLACHRADRSHKPSALPRRTPRARHPLPGDAAEDCMRALRAPPPNLPTFRWTGLGRGPPRSDPEIFNAGLEVWAALDAAWAAREVLLSTRFTLLHYYDLLFPVHAPSIDTESTTDFLRFPAIGPLAAVPPVPVGPSRRPPLFATVTFLSPPSTPTSSSAARSPRCRRTQKAHQWKSVCSATAGDNFQELLPPSLRLRYSRRPFYAVWAAAGPCTSFDDTEAPTYQPSTRCSRRRREDFDDARALSASTASAPLASPPLVIPPLPRRRGGRPRPSPSPTPAIQATPTPRVLSRPF